jgi:predicted regulator of Ras-like GTPase activity (Roadblock/LC7/MglB family)
MAENDFGDYFISDADEDLIEEDEDIVPPVVMPAPSAATPPSALSAVIPEVVPAAPASASPVIEAPSSVLPVTTAPELAPQIEAQPTIEVEAPPAAAAESQQPTSDHENREARLARTLNDLMTENVDIQATALVSLDGFTMASALPEGMHEDRVGAMSAAILGLGERAAAELGRGALSQVFIEGDDGYVVLIAAGSRAVLTALADSEAKLGLVLYDMRDTAQAIGEILG